MGLGQRKRRRYVERRVVCFFFSPVSLRKGPRHLELSQTKFNLKVALHLIHGHTGTRRDTVNWREQELCLRRQPANQHDGNQTLSKTIQPLLLCAPDDAV